MYLDRWPLMRNGSFQVFQRSLLQHLIAFERFQLFNRLHIAIPPFNDRNF